MGLGAQNEEQGRRVQVAREAREDLKRAFVRVLQVVQVDHERATLGEGQEPGAERSWHGGWRAAIVGWVKDVQQGLALRPGEQGREPFTLAFTRTHAAR